jgi:hypothetical protein
MSESGHRPRGQRQLAALAASGGLVFYVAVALGLAFAAGILWAIRFLG